MSEPILNLLLVDDEDSVREPLARHLRAKPYKYEVKDVANFEEALQVLEETKGYFDVALIDEVLKEGPSGLDLLRQIKTQYPQIECILFTGWGMQSGLEALRAGAYRYFAKPFNLEEIALTIRFAAEESQRHLERRFLSALVKVGQGMTQTTQQSEQLALAWDFVRQQLDVSTFFIGLNTPDKKRICFPLAYDDDQPKKLDNTILGKNRREWGLAGYVVKTGEEILWSTMEEMEQVCKAKKITPILEGKPSASGYCVPLCIGGQIRGALSAQSYQPYVFTPVLQNALRALSSQLSVALENSRLFAEAERKTKDIERQTSSLAALQGLALTINSSLDPEEILTRTCQVAVEFFHADHSGLVLFDSEFIRGKVEAEYPALGALGKIIPLRGIPAAERLIETKEPLKVGNVAADESFGIVRDTLLELEIQSILIVPIVSKDRVLGSFSLDAVHQPRSFGDEEVELCKTFAAQVAVTIENARLFEETQRRADQLEALRRTTLAITSPLDRNTLLRTIVKQAVELLGAKSGGIYEYYPARGELTVIAEYRRPDHVGKTLKVGEGMAGQLVQSDKPYMIVDDYNTWPSKAGIYGDQRMFGAVIEVPLKWQENTIGILYIDDEVGRKFSSEDSRLLGLFADQVAIALVNAELIQITERRKVELEHLHQAAKAMAGAFDIKQVLQTIVERAKDMLQADSSAIWSYDNIRDKFIPEELVAADIPDEELQKFREEEPKPGRTAYTVMERGWIGVTDISSPEFEFLGQPTRELLKRIGVISFQGIALRVGDEPVGVLYVNYKQPRTFGEEDLRHLENLATYAALSLKKARLLDQVSKGKKAAEVVARVTVLGDREATLSSVAQGTQETVGCDAVVLYAYDQATDKLVHPPIMVGVHHPDRASVYGEVLHDSIVYKMLERDEPYIVERIAEDALFKDRRFAREEGIESCVAISLKEAGQKVGVMFVNFRSSHRFTADELTNIELFANQAAVAIENARLYDAAEQRAKNLHAVLDVSQTAISSLDLERILNATCGAAVDLLKVDHSGLVLFDQDLAIGKVCAEYPEIGTVGVEFPLHGVPAEEQLIATKKPLMVPDVASEPGFDPVRDILTKLGTCSILIVPIVSKGQILGSFGLDVMKHQRVFTEEEVELCTIFAAQVAVAIENAQQYEELRTMKALVGPRTATEWMRMVSMAWGHAIKRESGLGLRYLELIRQELETEDTAKAKQDLTSLEIVVERIKDIPIVAPLAKEDKIMPIFVNGLIRKHVDRMWQHEPYLFAELIWNLQPDLDDIATVVASPQWVLRCLEIFVDNAINAMLDFNNSTRRVEIATRVSDKEVQILVTDNGPGFPPHLRNGPIGIDPVHKLEGSLGAGLGLVLAKNIAQTYGGDIHVVNTGSDGTTMAISLPRERL